MRKVLLHICCGICAYASIERLKRDGYRVEGFYYNPNIDTKEEYCKRLKVAQEVCDMTSVALHQGSYESALWDTACGVYKDEREGGKRCSLCYEMRIKETLARAQAMGIEYIATTLTISPHKASSTIFEIGSMLAQERFLAIDFKKEDGFKKSIEAAKKFDLYRQNYCGCEYSKPAASHRPQASGLR